MLPKQLDFAQLQGFKSAYGGFHERGTVPDLIDAIPPAPLSSYPKVQDILRKMFIIS